jgi:hypothetical protein
MNRYAKVLTASALAYTAEASIAAKWAKGTTMSYCSRPDACVRGAAACSGVVSGQLFADIGGR